STTLSCVSPMQPGIRPSWFGRTSWLPSLSLSTVAQRNAHGPMAERGVVTVNQFKPPGTAAEENRRKQKESDCARFCAVLPGHDFRFLPVFSGRKPPLEPAAHVRVHRRQVHVSRRAMLWQGS